MLKGSSLGTSSTKKSEGKAKISSQKSLQKSLLEYKEEAIPFDEIMRALVRAKPQHIKKKRM